MRKGADAGSLNRAAQPRRVRAFIDLAIERLLDTPTVVLSAKELNGMAVKGGAGRRQQRTSR